MKNLRSVMYIIVVLLVGWGHLAAQIPLSLPRISAKPGATLRIPVAVGDLTGKNLGAFEFVVSCDTTFMRFTGTDQEGTLSSGLMMFANNRVRPYGPGKMKVVCATARPISGSGVLVYVTGVTQMKAGISALRMSDCLLNAGSPSAKSIDGSIKVSAPVATRSTNPRDTLARKK